MAIYDDWSINYSTKKISHISGATVYSVNALYSWLQDTFDELGQLDDTVPMKANTPTEYELINGWEFEADTDLRFLSGGSVVVNKTGGNDVWANFYTLGSIESGTQLYVVQNSQLLTSYWSTGHVDILVRTISGGSAIDNRNITLFGRELSDNYDHFEIQAPNTGGRNAVPIATSNDLNNQTAAATISGYSDISITFGSISRDLNNGNGSQPYDVEINCAGRTLAQVYEYLKYVTRRGSDTVLNGKLGDKYLAAQVGYTPVKTSPFGTFAGGKFFGARGVWITNYDAADVKNFQLTDANNTTQTPPNLVAVTVSGVISGDRVAVFRINGAGGAIIKNQYVLNWNNFVGSTNIVVNNIIASDTPQAGTIRISGDDRFVYTSWSSSTSAFAITTPLPRTYAAGVSGFVPLIDGMATSTSISNTLIQSSTIPVIVRVRRKGILPFEIESSVTSTGMTVSAIRTTDTIVT